MIRGVGLRSAVAINVATMIGAGPLVTIPLVVIALHGSISVTAWIVGALVALCDGLVYAELAARLPRSGGTYAYVREAFGARGPGRLAAFLFVWQFCFWAPLTLASGYIGFAQYAAFLAPALSGRLAQQLLAMLVGAIVIVALYRAIPVIARTAIVLGSIALATLAVVAAAGLTHPHVALAALAGPAFSFGGVGAGAFGAALVITLYDYGGYNDVCALGEEVRRPERTIPLAIVISVGLVAVAYVALNLGVFATLPIDAVARSRSVASDVIERTLGHPAAVAVTLAVLVTAFASTYGLLLGASRVPFAAARDGDFLRAFARLHPRLKFPSVSLLALGLLALPAALLPLDAVIAALTAGIALVQGAAQIVALAILRARAPAAPFRVPLYPLPALIAGAGWIYLFASSGAAAMAFGCVTPAAGAAVFLARARRARAWPFAVPIAAVVLTLCGGPAPAIAAEFTHSAIVERDGAPVLEADGTPFFFYGAAFFYERIPPDRWGASMDALQTMGFNTLDLYVPWNWHELADGDFDFTGRTNPRRNLRAVIALARAHGFRLVVRPGPVIRNEWRNGGYPAWLLLRPEYGMPLHDVLEGRYPATATLQNARSDDAAAEWLANATHRRYAARWLQTALREFVPVADRVLAVQLDDDQGAYIDNQTWPAPHLTAYVRWLESTVRSVTGPRLPVFINTYEMKVTAGAPVWAMGNWYQSDAYAIGEHDRSALEFSTGLLQTQTNGPPAISEFQAGWLAPPEDPLPRPADPSNTTLALHVLLGMGIHGAIDFPAQDTRNPPGWEAPFANVAYAWDAALDADGAPAPRYAPTARFGELVRAHGARLARAQRVVDGAIAVLTSAYDPARLTNADVFAIAARTQSAQQRCRLQRLTCDLVDLRFVDAARLQRYPFVVVPAGAAALPFVAAIEAKLARYRSGGGATPGVPPALAHPAAAGLADATLLAGPGGDAFLDLVNFDDRPRDVPATRVPLTDGSTWTVGPLHVAPRDAILLERGVPDATPAPALRRLPHDLRRPVPPLCTAADPPALETPPTVRSTDAERDGEPETILANGNVSVAIVADAGARAFSFSAERGCAAGVNVFTTVGALRDDAELQPPLSTTDRIGKYTRSFPPGTFNRAYAVSTGVQARSAAATFSYTAPDVVPRGARFERTVTLAAGERRFTVDERADFAPGPDAGRQRAVTYASFDTRTAVTIDARADGAVGFFDARRRSVTSLAWRPGDVEDVQLLPQRTSTVVRLRFAAGGTRRTAYAIGRADDEDAAGLLLRKERDALAAKPMPGRGEVAKR